MAPDWESTIRIICGLLFFGLLFAAALIDPSEPEPREQVDWLQPATDLDETERAS
jgi:hypothetical protein